MQILKKALSYVADQALSKLQRRCEHPGRMVAADILEGSFDGIAVSYCRRCGAIKTDWNPNKASGSVIALPHYWRLPDPNLWRG